MTFREFAQRSYQLPDRFVPNRYADIAHGLGVATEYPMIHYIQDWDDYGYDGVIENGVVLCLEVYVGEPGGNEGVKLENQVYVTDEGMATNIPPHNLNVKLENQVYVTDEGTELLDTFPIDLIPQ